MTLQMIILCHCQLCNLFQPIKSKHSKERINGHNMKKFCKPFQITFVETSLMSPTILNTSIPESALNKLSKAFEPCRVPLNYFSQECHGYFSNNTMNGSVIRTRFSCQQIKDICELERRRKY